jgi:elongation factor Ts
MAISAAEVKTLRTQTGAGMMDCKRALTDADGDAERAIELLRERGLAKAGKRAGRTTSEGVIGIARSGPVAAMVELACETDFVARTDEYQALGQEIADLVAGNPDLAELEKTLVAPMGDATVEARIQAAIGKLGENIELKRVARLEVAQGVSGGYVHAGGKLGVIVCVESDLSGLAEGADAQIETLAKDLAMHVAAADPTPLSVDRTGMPEDAVEKERRVLRAQAEQSGKPE